MSDNIKAHPGPQTDFLKTSADVCLFGGSAGGGKSFALLLDPLRYVYVKDFYCIIFRRHQTEVTLPGGLVDESKKIYPLMGAQYYSSSKTWVFPSGAKIVLRGLELVDDMYQYKGVQVNAVYWDELTSFEESQFWYLFSRIRSTNSIKGYVKCTTNPQSEGFVKDLIESAGYLREDGFAEDTMSGVVKWFVRAGGDLLWYDTKEEAVKDAAAEMGVPEKEILPQSFTFIRSSLSDNPSIGVDYRSKLLGMPEKDRQELLGGNWNYQPSNGMYYKSDWVEIIPANQLPRMKKIVRAWDLAATPVSTVNKNPDWTVGIKMGLGDDGYYYILDVIRFRDSIAKVKEATKRAATNDGIRTTISIPLDPGGHGKHAYQDHVKNLVGYVVKKSKTEKTKLERFMPFASVAENGLVKMVQGDWNKAFNNELEAFIADGKKKDDQVDAVSDGFKILNEAIELPDTLSLGLEMGHQDSPWAIPY